MELDQIIKIRRSTRLFTDTPINESTIEQLIEAGSHAPSACNKQAWKFIVIDKPEIKQILVDHGGSIVINNAPQGILVLYDNRTNNFDYNDDVQSASAAIQNILLKASELGLGACWICHLPAKKTLRKLLDIPSYFSPIAYILIGYPKNADRADVPRRYKPKEIISYNKFDEAWPVDSINAFNLNLQKFLITIYDFTPVFIKKLFLNKLLDKKFVKKFKN
jgi:nitroreductase